MNTITITTADVDKISDQQRDVLTWLLNAYHAGTATAFGVPYYTGGGPSSRASMSRTLARLERRGLVLRQNPNTGEREPRTAASDPKANRTSHISFTPLGRAVATHLSDQAS
jgi:hypothetical protein